MYIQSFHIDSFGKLAHVGVENLPCGLVVFLGNNEAGKSTCLEFFRTMLTGYTSQKKDIFEHRAGTQMKAGGSLLLQTPSHGAVQLTRRPGKGTGLMWLTDTHGETLEPHLLDKILAGVTRDVYRNVFGFSLSELQFLESLSSDEVRHALYGASFGMHLRSPSSVLKELTAQMEKRFKNKGSTPFLNVIIKEWDEVQKHLRHAQSQCAQFDSLSIKKQELESEIQNIRTQRGDTELQRRQAERQLGVWKQWDEWRTTEQRLARLEPVAKTFPHDGPARLEKAQHLSLEAKRRIQTQEARCQKIENLLAELPLHNELLQKRSALQSLSERKTSFRQAQTALEPLTAQIQRNEALLQERLADLGPKWTCARIRTMDRSLFIRSELEKCASQIQATEGAHKAATVALEKANTHAEHMRHAVEIARTSLHAVPQPEALLPQETREEIRRSLALMESAQQSLHEKKHALRQARQTLHRTLSPLHIPHDADETHTDKAYKNTLFQKLESLTQTREQGLRLAQEAQEARKQRFMSEQTVMQAQEEEDSFRSRVERVRRHKNDMGSSSRKHVDK